MRATHFANEKRQQMSHVLQSTDKKKYIDCQVYLIRCIQSKKNRFEICFVGYWVHVKFWGTKHLEYGLHFWCIKMGDWKSNSYSSELSFIVIKEEFDYEQIKVFL